MQREYVRRGRRWHHGHVRRGRGTELGEHSGTNMERNRCVKQGHLECGCCSFIGIQITERIAGGKYHIRLSLTLRES